MTPGRPRYEILVEPLARRALNKLPRAVSARLIARIETLRENPRPSGAIKLTGENAYRIRTGDYRIIYQILDDRLLVIVLDAGHRREIYRKW